MDNKISVGGRTYFVGVDLSYDIKYDILDQIQVFIKRGEVPNVIIFNKIGELKMLKRFDWDYLHSHYRGFPLVVDSNREKLVEVL